MSLGILTGRLSISGRLFILRGWVEYSGSYGCCIIMRGLFLGVRGSISADGQYRVARAVKYQSSNCPYRPDILGLDMLKETPLKRTGKEVIKNRSAPSSALPRYNKIGDLQ